MDKNKEIKEKEIEEMAFIAGYKLHETFIETSCTDCDNYEVCKNASTPLECTAVIASRNLYKAGYGNVKQAVKEFVEDLKEIMYDLMFPISENKNGFCNYNGTGRVVVDVENLIKEIDAYLSEMYGED